MIANVAYYHRGGLSKSKRVYYFDLRVQDREVVRKLAAGGAPHPARLTAITKGVSAACIVKSAMTKFV